ncbi:interleukin-8-like [Stegostoma tigrinum]|uniref:interleukin-8-like n=1 Tax=Stegostoma tigrinum TaxID=3053191 RepID=UPI00202B4052|nr:interleukin-8-like [Stegostoma tigrinum]
MNSKVTVLNLTLFVLYGTSTQGMSLRCQCIKTASTFIHPQFMENIEIIPSGPHCENVEIIVTLQNSDRVCLNPKSPWVHKIIDRIMSRSKKTTKDQ